VNASILAAQLSAKSLFSVGVFYPKYRRRASDLWQADGKQQTVSRENPSLLVTDAHIRDPSGIGRGMCYEPCVRKQQSRRQMESWARQLEADPLACLGQVSGGKALPIQLKQFSWSSRGIPAPESVLLQQIHFLDFTQFRGLQFAEVDATGDVGSIPGDTVPTCFLNLIH